MSLCFGTISRDFEIRPPNINHKNMNFRKGLLMLRSKNTQERSSHLGPILTQTAVLGTMNYFHQHFILVPVAVNS